jgi:filamentous hemagglutinin family protein
MNRAYKLVWNTVSASWVVTSELAKGRKKSSSMTLTLAVAMASLLGSTTALATTGVVLPSGESLASGTATFDRSVINQLTVNQSTSKLITNWSSFDIGTGGKVIFAQPDASSIALNRVSSGSASQIAGQLSANGRLVIVNPNGITFAAGSQVSAASIIGSVLNITDSDFNAGTLLFSRGSATGTVDNKGSITATAGSVSLLAPTLKNSGSISATSGNASLINANAVNLSAVDPSISTASTITGLIQQSGSITATQVSTVGGKILLKGDISQSASNIELGGSASAIETAVNGRLISVTKMLDVNGASNTLKLTHTAGYNLNGGPVNLNGASSGFSVNGTAYTVIRDINQLQAMTADRAGNYVLANDIDASATSGWNSGQGFEPIGAFQTAYFSGKFDGLGHVINSLTINRPTEFDVALMGAVDGADIRNVGLSNVNLHGGEYVGGIASFLNASSISNSFVTGSVSGSTRVGGLAGDLETGSVINNAYSAASVTATNMEAGGLTGTLLSGSVINNSYATGSVSGGTTVAGLVGGITDATINNSYWNTQTSGQAQAVFVSSNSTLNNAVGLTSTQFSQLASFANWGGTIDAQGGTGSTWRIYEGQTAPLLRTFLKPLTISAGGVKTYDGTHYAGYMFSLGGVDTSRIINFGNLTFGGTALGAQHVGQYATATIANGGQLYSVQNGYDILGVIATGSLTINKANLTISSTDGSKTYDGTTTVTGVNAVAAGGTQLFGSDSLSGGTFTFDNKNAGTGKHVLVSGVTVNDGNNGGNYTVTYADNTSSTINKASLSITATDASKVYDGTTTAKSTAVVTAGSLFGSDSLIGATFNYDDKNAGTGKHVIVSAAQISDGNNGDNYDVTYVDNTNSSISKRLLTISAVADSKEYDGKLGSSATGKPVVAGRQRGDSIVSLTQSYLDKNAGTGKAINVDAGYTIRDGNGGNNYDVVIVNSNAGVITPKALTISTVANSKVYDGGLTSANKPLVTGVVAGDRVTGLFQQYETKTVGTGKKLLIKSGYVVQDGNSGGNYIVTEQGSNDGVITAH